MNIESDILGRISVVQDHIPEEFVEAVDLELSRLIKYDFGEIVTRAPTGVEILECRLVLTLKTLKDGKFKYKARLVVRGYQQSFEMILAELYSPVGTAESLRLLFAHSALNGWTLEQVDFDVAFIQSDLLKEEERVYVQMPLGIPKFLLDRFGWKDGQIMYLKKPLYGLKQAPLFWYKTLSKKMVEFGYIPVERDSCLFTTPDRKFLSFMHVDDMILAAPRDSGEIDRAKERLKSRFDLREEGYPKLFVGLQVEEFGNGIFIHQTRYTLKVLEEFGELEGKWSKTPISPNSKFIESLIEESKTPDYEFMKMIPYREFIGAASWFAKEIIPSFRERSQSFRPLKVLNKLKL